MRVYLTATASETVFMKNLIGTVLTAAMVSAVSVHACEPATDSSRMVAAGGSMTEIIYFLGAEERLIAVDTTSTYPAEATALPNVGYVRNVSAEGLLSLSPTLIIGEDDMGPPEVIEQLQRTGVEVVIVPETLSAAGIIEKVRCVANIIGAQEQAQQRIDTELTPLKAALNDRRDFSSDRAVSAAFFLRFNDGTPMVAGSNTSGHGLLTMAGINNSFADLDGWKPVSLEAMAAANPDVIIIPSRGANSAGGIDAVLRHPAVKLTNAGRHKNIIAMDGMRLLGYGPRTLETALELSQQAAP